MGHRVPGRNNTRPTRIWNWEEEWTGPRQGKPESASLSLGCHAHAPQAAFIPSSRRPSLPAPPPRPRCGWWALSSGHRQELVAKASPYRGAIFWKQKFLIWGNLEDSNRKFPGSLWQGFSWMKLQFGGACEVVVVSEVISEAVRKWQNIWKPRRKGRSWTVSWLRTKPCKQKPLKEFSGKVHSESSQRWEAMNLSKICMVM